MRKTVISFGEVLWDLLPTGPVLGGAPGNFAFRVNSLGDEGIMISRVGQDEAGSKAVAQLAANGMNLAAVQRDESLPTGTVRVALDANREPDYFIVPGVAYDAIEVTPPLLALAARADAFCFGTLAQRSPQSRATLYELLDQVGDGLKFLDVNLRKDCYTLETVAESLRRAEVLKLNEAEAVFLAEVSGLSAASPGEFCQRMVDRWSLDHCVMTLGEKGSLAVSANNTRVVYVPGYQIALVDPCGSGDAFSAGFLHGLLRQWPLPECCELGNALGALVATQHGATELITWSDIEMFSSEPPARIWDARFKAMAAV